MYLCNSSYECAVCLRDDKWMGNDFVKMIKMVGMVSWRRYVCTVGDPSVTHHWMLGMYSWYVYAV